MQRAQQEFDSSAAPLAPQHLTSPALHAVLSCPAIQRHIWGGKGVGSQASRQASTASACSSTGTSHTMKLPSYGSMRSKDVCAAPNRSVAINLHLSAGGVCPALIANAVSASM